MKHHNIFLKWLAQKWWVVLSVFFASWLLIFSLIDYYPRYMTQKEGYWVVAHAEKHIVFRPNKCSSTTGTVIFNGKKYRVELGCTEYADGDRVMLKYNDYYDALADGDFNYLTALIICVVGGTFVILLGLYVLIFVPLKP